LQLGWVHEAKFGRQCDGRHGGVVIFRGIFRSNFLPGGNSHIETVSSSLGEPSRARELDGGMGGKAKAVKYGRILSCRTVSGGIGPLLHRRKQWGVAAEIVG
jgi:hypothetical protein